MKEIEEKDLLDGEFCFEDLFNASNTCNTENIEYVDFDDGIPHKPMTPFEELHCEAYDKFLVPLFADEKMELFRGKGVIVGPYLITVAHVAQSEPNEYGEKDNLSGLFFPFEKKVVKVCDDDIIHDGRGFHLQDENLDDIIVYELVETQGSFKLNTERIEESMEMAARLYCRCENSRGVVPNNTVCRVVSLEAKYMNRNVWKNCYKIENQWLISSGNSGGALFRNDIVYGIITRAGTFEGTVIDSRYIQKIIESKKQTNV